MGEVTAAVRAEIAEDLRVSGLEVLGLEPLLVRKAPPAPVEAPPPPPRSKTPLYIGGGVVAAIALLLALAPHGGTAAPVAPVPTLEIHARGTVTPPSHTGRDRGRDIRSVSIARARQAEVDLPCPEVGSDCEPGDGTERRARRGR